VEYEVSTEFLRSVFLSLAVVAGVTVIACREVRAPVKGSPSGQRVLLIGIDGATWEDLEPLLAAGQLPNLDRLRRDGAWGILKSFHPTASAIIWTSIATGKTPEKHGIRAFVAPLPTGELVPVSSNMRRVEAIWNILSTAGIRVGVVGWWVSWPAEEVLGFFCSDYTWPLKKDRQGFAIGRDSSLELSRRTWPEEILVEIRPFLVTPESVSPQERIGMGLDRIPPTGGYAVSEILCKDHSYMEGGLHLLDRYGLALRRWRCAAAARSTGGGRSPGNPLPEYRPLPRTIDRNFRRRHHGHDRFRSRLWR
jgi:hypothetical protein